MQMNYFSTADCWDALDINGFFPESFFAVSLNMAQCMLYPLNTCQSHRRSSGASAPHRLNEGIKHQHSL